jgi:hypothetical protein
MGQVAGILVSYRLLDASHRGIQLDAGEEFVDVHQAGAELTGLFGVGRIVREQFRILLERGAATAGVVEDHVVAAS